MVIRVLIYLLPPGSSSSLFSSLPNKFLYDQQEVFTLDFCKDLFVFSFSSSGILDRMSFITSLRESNVVFLRSIDVFLHSFIF